MRKRLLTASLLVALGGGAASSDASSQQFVARQSAMASWYGPGLYGNSLACGGRLYTNTWGVAHKYLPCGTRLKLCYRRCVNVRVIDRGPFVAGRDFDLTYPVMRAIGMYGGVARIRYYIRGH